MTDRDFAAGRLAFTVEEMEKTAAAAVLCEPWQDGYLAFSTGEIRLASLTQTQLKNLADGRVGEIHEGVSGYLMEVGLWRRDAGSGQFVEACLEREDDRYLVQRWELDTGPESNAGHKCFYGLAENLPARKGLFKEEGLDAIEVIVPENRMHFFMTTGGPHHAETED